MDAGHAANAAALPVRLTDIAANAAPRDGAPRQQPILSSNRSGSNRVWRVGARAIRHSRSDRRTEKPRAPDSRAGHLRGTRQFSVSGGGGPKEARILVRLEVFMRLSGSAAPYNAWRRLPFRRTAFFTTALRAALGTVSDGRRSQRSAMEFDAAGLANGRPLLRSVIDGEVPGKPSADARIRVPPRWRRWRIAVARGPLGEPWAKKCDR